ncbi:MAG TPA: Tn3 family transposase [Candidatus Paceibacterota bacterium]
MEKLITWDKFNESVEEVEKLFKNTNKNSFDLLNKYYGDLRKYTPILLKGLEFENTTNSCKELMEALTIIKDLNESKNYESLEEIIGEDEKIHLKRLEKNTPEEAKRLSSALYKMVPKISLPDLLLEIAKTTKFHTHFLHAANQQPVESFQDITVLIFAIMGLGTNVGLSKISESLNNISYRKSAYEIFTQIFC